MLGVDLEYESRHEGMMRKVSEELLRDDSIKDPLKVVVKPFNLSERTQEYKERYNLWNGKAV